MVCNTRLIYELVLQQYSIRDLDHDLIVFLGYKRTLQHNYTSL